MVIKRFANAFRGEETITISLEGYSDSYKVQKALLIDSSPYFDRVLNTILEGREAKVLRILNCEPATFEWFWYWLEHKRLPSLEPRVREMIDDHCVLEESVAEPLHNRLVRAWVFGDAHFVPEFQNACMRLLLKFLDVSKVQPSTVNHVMAITCEESALHKVVVGEAIADFAIADCLRTTFQDETTAMDASDAIPVFTLAFARRLREKTPASEDIVYESPSRSRVEQFLVEIRR